MPIRRHLLVFFALVVAALLYALPATGDAPLVGGPNNLVQVSTTGVGDVESRSNVQVASFGGPVSGSTNAAIAVSTDCTDCRTIAIAFQAVFLINDPPVLVPGNGAVAVNAACTRCQTFAFAYQYELFTHGPVFLSPAGHMLLNDLRAEVTDLAQSNLPLPDLDARLKDVKARFKALIDSELVAAGQPPNGVEETKVEQAPDA
jgi:putative peptide zinc metalloprotease protein